VVFVFDLKNIFHPFHVNNYKIYQRRQQSHCIEDKILLDPTDGRGMIRSPDLFFIYTGYL